MNAGEAISFFQEAFTLAAMLSAPALALGLIVGLTVSIFQAVTQINEQTLSLIPKIMAIVAALMVSANWMLQHLLKFTERVFTQIQNVGG